MSTQKPIPDGISPTHVLAALRELDEAKPHAFAEPTRWLLVHDSKLYPPKAAIGLAARHAFGSALKSSEFSNGEAPRQAVGYLRGLGFQVIPKVGEPATDSTEASPPRVSFTHPERAVQLYHMLIAAAGNRQTLTYQQVSNLTGCFPAALGEVLGYLMNWCSSQRLPPLTVLVVRTGSGKPGPGLLTSADHDADRERVFDLNWYRIKPPTGQELQQHAPSRTSSEGESATSTA